jgi:hypothetical protein
MIKDAKNLINPSLEKPCLFHVARIMNFEVDIFGI